jgi:hypothetical protein
VFTTITALLLAAAQPAPPPPQPVLKETTIAEAEGPFVLGTIPFTAKLKPVAPAAARPAPPVVYHEILGAVAAGPPVTYVPPVPVYYNSPPARTAWLPPGARTRGGYWWVTNRVGGPRPFRR